MNTLIYPMFNYILWNPPTGVQLGPISIRYYSICWGIGLLLAYMIVQKLYKLQNIPEEKFSPLFVYCFIGIFVGARLGHCLFYDPDYYYHHILEIFLPLKETPDGWKFIGYAGLASHGGTIGLIAALWFYVRRTKLNILCVLDNIAIATPIAACFIRLGNLMNSEIIGKVTDVPYAFIFSSITIEPRHPAQLYEAIAYLLFFITGIILYYKYPQKVGTGFFFGFCLTTIFTFRFFVEYVKEVQGGIDDGSLMIDLGQILSIPFILLGIACLVGGKWLKRFSIVSKKI
ncbi:MAG: prolipoprotein diacylglyceryl transferase [Bacteroidales bacterium]